MVQPCAVVTGVALSDMELPVRLPPRRTSRPTPPTYPPPPPPPQRRRLESAVLGSGSDSAGLEPAGSGQHAVGHGHDEQGPAQGLFQLPARGLQLAVLGSGSGSAGLEPAGSGQHAVPDHVRAFRQRMAERQLARMAERARKAEEAHRQQAEGAEEARMTEQAEEAVPDHVRAFRQRMAEREQARMAEQARKAVSEEELPRPRPSTAPQLSSDPDSAGHRPRPSTQQSAEPLRLHRRTPSGWLQESEDVGDIAPGDVLASVDVPSTQWASASVLASVDVPWLSRASDSASTRLRPGIRPGILGLGLAGPRPRPRQGLGSMMSMMSGSR